MLWKKCHYSWPVPTYGGNLQKLLVQYKKMKVVKLQAEYASCYCTPNTRRETQFLPSFRQRINSLPRDPEPECLHLLHSLTLDQPSGIPCNSNEEKKGTSVFNRVVLHIEFMNIEVPMSLCWLYTCRFDSCLQCIHQHSDRRDQPQLYGLIKGMTLFMTETTEREHANLCKEEYKFVRFEKELLELTKVFMVHVTKPMPNNTYTAWQSPAPNLLTQHHKRGINNVSSFIKHFFQNIDIV